MDPMLQRLGDVTIQRLEKPKESKPAPPIANDNATLEKEKKAEPPPPAPPPAVVEPIPPMITPQVVNAETAKRFYDDLPGPSNKKPRYEDYKPHMDNLKPHTEHFKPHMEQFKPNQDNFKPHMDNFKPHVDNFSTHSYSDNELSDYEYESEIESEPENPPEMQQQTDVKLEPGSNYEDESQEGNEGTDFLEKLVQAPFMNSDEIKLEPVSKPDDDYDYDIKEKLKEMGEISFETVKKGDSKPKKVEVKENEVSVVPAKKTGNEEGEGPSRERQGGGGNMRRNIREVMDETKLDESTLAAQRQEMERLRRVQEQQRLIREVQRQMAQERVISMLQGNHLPKPSTSTTSRVGSTVLVKLPNGQTKPMTKLSKKPSDLMRVPRGAIPPHQQKLPRSLLTPKRPIPSQAHLTPSVSIAPVGKRPMDFSRPPSESDSDSEEMMLRRPVGRPKLKEAPPVQTIDISSDDDCIVVSESENDPTSDDVEDPTNSGMHTNDVFNQPDEQGRVVINIGHPEDEGDIYLAPQIARIIKPHQIGGIRFLYDNIIESINRFETSTGFGCILAHSMGLGKTLQVVTFSDIFLRHTPAKTILCIMPINTLQNWLAEYNMWLPTEEASANSSLLVHGEVRPRHFNLHVLNDSHKTLAARAKVIHEWRALGGVLLIGYEQYRLLSLRKYPKSRSKKPEQRMHDEDRNKALFDEVHEALVKPGPDLVICDEGHRIKNSHASISLALKQMKTKRRVVLTGYPLQNNLMEYWCMVDFVRPNYLGTKTEFCNMFERPIQNGQCIDSTEADIKLMRYRAHVLHSLLLGFVQRRSHRVLQTALPQKEEYVLLCRMTDFQRTLYETFMNEVVRTQTVPNPLKAFAVCCKIWNHPDVLHYYLKKQAKGEAVDIDLEEVSNSTGSSEAALATKPKPSRAKRPPAKGRKSKPAASVTPYSTNTPPEPPPIVPPIDTTPPTQPNQTFTTPTKDQPYQNNFEQNNYNQFPPNQPNNFENNYNTNTFGNSFNTPPNNYQSDSSYQSPPAQNQNYPPNTNYQQNFPQQANPAFRNQNYNQPQTTAPPYNGQPYNYQNQNYWNPDTKPPTTGDNYYGGDYNNQYNQNASSWIKQEDIKTEPETKPKINIISDIKISNVYDSLGNISPEKKINILSDIKLEPKKEELELKEESGETNDVVAKAPSAPPEVKSCEIEDDPKVERNDSAAIVARNAAMGTVAGKEDTGIPYDWAKELLKDYIPGCIENSAKMEILFCIIKESLALGDRLLVFSQSLITLDLIEQFLQMNVVPSGSPDAQHWAKNSSYYRLDGSTSALEREKLINEFNSNPKVYLFLVSTRAGSLGINLIGANRVVVLDASWNPCHDTQAVCRVYRYGQRKPCFVYRLVVDNCLEKKIYDRQINKQGMSDRVVDECNPDAHLTMKDVSTLCWDDDKETEERDWSHTKDNYIDVVLQKVLIKHGRRLNKEPFQHESLLVDRKEKQLSKQEKRLAKKGYEREKQATRQPSYGVAVGARGHRPVASVRPMQQGGDRPTRWIPAEHWQRQGMTAQEMTLPLDVVIPTNQPDKGNIVLKAGQKVLVLKSPKGVYMQLESGKIVAIKTAIKMRGKAEEEASKAAKAALPAAIKNNSALTVLPTLPKRPVKPFSPGMTKFNMRSVKQAMPNVMSMHKMSNKKVQMAKTRPYQMNELAKSMRAHHDMELHPSSSEDEKSPEKRLSFPFRGEGQISLLKPHGMMRSESDNELQRSEEDSSESSKDSMQQHHFKGVGKATSSSALRQLEESTSAIISEKQPFQDTLDSITSSYQEDKSQDHTNHEELSQPQIQPIQIEDDSPVECDESYEQPSTAQPPAAVPDAPIKSEIPPADYSYNNYYGYNYPHPPPPQGYPPYPPQPPYDMYPPPQQQPQQQPPPYNYPVYPQGYPPQPQYPPPPPQPYEYAPPPPQPIYGGYPPYPPQQYPPPPPQGMYPPQNSAPYPDYNYPAAPPPPVAPAYYPPQS